jgi:hypothetical protein
VILGDVWFEDRSLESLCGLWSVPAGTTVFVCENQIVIETAAAQLGVQCPPMIELGGFPSQAVDCLMIDLGACGLTYERTPIMTRPETRWLGRYLWATSDSNRGGRADTSARPASKKIAGLGSWMISGRTR